MEFLLLGAGLLAALLLGPAGLIKLSRLKASDLLRQRYSISAKAFLFLGLTEFAAALAILLGTADGLEWIGFGGAVVGIGSIMWVLSHHLAAKDSFKEYLLPFSVIGLCIAYIMGLSL